MESMDRACGRHMKAPVHRPEDIPRISIASPLVSPGTPSRRPTAGRIRCTGTGSEAVGGPCTSPPDQGHGHGPAAGPHRPAARESRPSGLRHRVDVAIDIKPAPVTSLETAAFVQPHGSAGFAPARHELDFGLRGTERAVTAHLQPQPADGRIECEIGRHMRAVPGGAQVVLAQQDKGCLLYTSPSPRD